MNVYWLSRGDGAAAEGPFPLGTLRAMSQRGELGPGAIVCEEGMEDWWPLAEVLERDYMLPAVAAAPVREGWVLEERGPGGCLVAFIFMVGVFLAPVGFGLLLIVLAIVMDCKRLHYICQLCRNQVAKTSIQCPVCGARLKNIHDQTALAASVSAEEQAMMRKRANARTLRWVLIVGGLIVGIALLFAWGIKA